MFKTPLTKTALFYFWRKLESSKIIKLIEDCCQTRLTRGTIHQLLVNIIQAVVTKLSSNLLQQKQMLSSESEVEMMK